MGVVIPHTMRNCNKCDKHPLSDECDKLVNQNKEFSANLNELKRQAPNVFGHMLPWYKNNLNVIIILFNLLIMKYILTRKKIYTISI